MDALLKTLARGFWRGERAYLRSAWHRLDIYILCCSATFLYLEVSHHYPHHLTAHLAYRQAYKDMERRAGVP
jgi:hypothetical protein